MAFDDIHFIINVHELSSFYVEVIGVASLPKILFLQN